MTDGGAAVGAQTHLFDEPDASNATIETSGRVIRPFVGLVAALGDEIRITFDENGVPISHVDPANVAQVQTRAYPAAFDEYALGDGEFTIGVNLDTLRDQLQNARKGKTTDDGVELDIDGTRALVTTEREYDVTTLTQTNEVLAVDPDSIREPPEDPDLEHACRAEIDVAAFVDALESIRRVSGHVTITTDGDELVFGSGKQATPVDAGPDEETDEGARTLARFGSIVETHNTDAGTDPQYEDEPHWGVYSLDYLTDIAEGLKIGLVETVELRWSREWPVEAAFERRRDSGGDSDEVGELLYEGSYMLAPRTVSRGDGE